MLQKIDVGRGDGAEVLSLSVGIEISVPVTFANLFTVRQAR